MSKLMKPREIRVVKSPFPEMEDEPLPWIYDEDGFRNWVHEVLTEGYKNPKAKLPTLRQAIDITEGQGYTLEVV